MLTHEWDTEKSPARVVIMGAGGFVGGRIQARLEARGVSVLALGRQEVDLLKPGAAEELAKHLNPDDCFIAVSAIAPVKNLSMLADNVRMIEAMAEAVTKSPVAHIVNIGSDAVFADSDGPLNEKSSRAAASYHGVMHLTREVAFDEVSGDTPVATLRPTLIYGAADPHNGYGPNRFRRLTADGKTITLFGEGEERRDHVWVEDVAELATRIVMHRSSGSLNAATGTVISFKECAEAIAHMADTPPAIEGSPRNGPMPHNGYRPFDASATKTAFPDFTYTQPLDGFSKVKQEMDAS